MPEQRRAYHRPNRADREDEAPSRVFLPARHHPLDLAGQNDLQEDEPLRARGEPVRRDPEVPTRPVAKGGHRVDSGTVLPLRPADRSEAEGKRGEGE